jgi:hypothetical protein
MIRGGYILQPRVIEESDISVAPPYVREIWNYLLREANAKDNKYNGHEIKRGQLFRSYDDIREGTKWFVGWRKMTYNENQTKKAMKFLRDTGRITTLKEPGGVLITICKYNYYQDPKNYERTTEGTEERTIEEPLENQPIPDNNKNNKNNKNDNKEPVKKPVVPKYDFIDQIIEIFSEEYHVINQIEYNIISRGKERAAASKILKLHKDKHPEMDSAQTLDSLRTYFQMCVGINDEWLRSNMSLPIIVSKFNEINNILRNGKIKRINNGATDRELAEIVARKFASDCPKQ